MDREEARAVVRIVGRSWVGALARRAIPSVACWLGLSVVLGVGAEAQESSRWDGRVVDPWGRPVADAEVLAWLPRKTLDLEPEALVRSASDGSFSVELARTPEDPRGVLLWARSPSAVAASFLEVSKATDPRRPLELRLDELRPPPTSVRARHPDGSVAAGLRLELRAAKPARRSAPKKGPRGVRVVEPWRLRFEGRLGADARLDLPALFTPEFRLSLRDPMRPAVQARVETGRSDVLLQQELGRSLELRVADATEDLLRRSRIELHGVEANKRRPAAIEGDRLRWHGLSTTSTPWLMVMAPGHALAVREHVEPEEDGSVAVVRLAPERVLRGRVLDASDRPLVGALVRYSSRRVNQHPGATGPTGSPEEWLGLQARTDAKGEFVLRQLEPIAYRLRMDAEGLPRAAAEVDATQAEVVLRAGRFPADTLRLVGEAPAHWSYPQHLVFQRTGGGGSGLQPDRHVLRLPSAGPFELPGLRPGDWTLHYQGPSRAGRLELLDLPAGTHTISWAQDPR